MSPTAAYPRQRCAILIMDTSGFSRTAEERGIEAAVDAVMAFRAIAHVHVRAAGGTLVKAWADNFAATFGSVREAIIAASLISARVPAGGGIGFGEILMPVGDLWGVEVNRASKLGEDFAGAGEIKLTDAAVARLTVEVAGS